MLNCVNVPRSGKKRLPPETLARAYETLFPVNPALRSNTAFHIAGVRKALRKQDKTPSTSLRKASVLLLQPRAAILRRVNACLQASADLARSFRCEDDSRPVILDSRGSSA